MALYDYSQTPGSNTTISGINIAEGCNPSTINNAIRQLMADAREVYASATVASATTADIGAATATYINISGTTTITGFGTVAAGTWRVCKFAGALTLTHHGTSLILPGAANITTAAGDALYAVSEGAGNWRVVAYQRASGAPVSLSTAQVATTYIADAAVTTDKIAAAAVTFTKIGLMSAGTIISFASGGTATAVATGVTGTVLTSNGATLLPSFQTATAIVSASFDSGDIPVVAADGTAMPHSLPAKPKIIEYFIKCTDAGGEAGYSQNDEIHVSQLLTGQIVAGSGHQSGLGVKVDATNITIRFASTLTWTIPHATTGAQTTITTTKWALIIRAYA